MQLVPILLLLIMWFHCWKMFPLEELRVEIIYIDPVKVCHLFGLHCSKDNRRSATQKIVMKQYMQLRYNSY